MIIQCIRVIVVACCIAYSVAAYGVTFIPPVAPPESGYCFIQNYVDVGPEYGGQDCYTHSRSYERHKGTDFRVSYDAMLAGVDVLAAASGTVLRTRDGMDDAFFQNRMIDVEGRECGNGVIIDHGDGWQTQYCHLKKDSVLVAQGESVKAGSVLGKVGLSGKTEFAHVHFQVTCRGEIVCPFSGARLESMESRNSTGLQKIELGTPLWENESNEILQYVPPQLLKVNYSRSLPRSAREILQRPNMMETIKAGRAPFVFSVVTAMLRKGDLLTLRLKTESGKLLAQKVVNISSYTAQRVDCIGRKNVAMYAHMELEGIVELRRGDVQVFEHKSRILVQ
jgi:murein DD-endopeptidase MepM/ murein hydrolase activator NlpD